MSVADKLTTIAENEQKVYDKGFNDFVKLRTNGGTNFSYMFHSCRNLTTAPQLDTSKGTTFYNMFFNCSALTTVPQLDTSNGTTFNYMFNGCRNLTTVSQLDTSKGTTFTGTFNGCSTLKNITFTGSISANISFQQSTLLTHNSLMSIINALKDYSTSSSTYTLTLGSTNLAKLSDAEKQIASDKGWTLA